MANTSKLLVFSERELAFLQKLTRAEYHFLTDEEQTARQTLRDKLNEVVLIPRENKIAVNLTGDEIAFLALLVRESRSFVTASEGDARGALYERLDRAAKGLDP